MGENTKNKILISLCCIFLLGTIGLIIFNQATKKTITVPNTTTTEEMVTTTKEATTTTELITTKPVTTKKTIKR